MSLSKSMTQGKPMGLILKFSLPIMLGGMFQLIYSIVDSAVVGRMIGVEAFAAVGAAGNLHWMIFSVVMGLTQGFGTVIAQYFGAGDKEGVKKSVAMSWVLTVVLGIFVSIFSLLMTRPLLNVLRTPDEIMADAVIYLQISFSGMLITFVYNNLGAVFRAVGNSKIPLYALIISSVINVVLDIVLVKFTPLGVAAVAIATVISQILSCVYCFYHLRKMKELRLSKKDFKLDKRILISHIRLGGPIGFRNLVIALGGTVAQYYVNGYGTDFIAGISVTKRMYGLIEIIAMGIEGALATYVAQNYGAKRMDRIKRGVKAGFIILVVGAAIIMTIMFVFGRNIMGLLVSGEPAQVNAVLDVAQEQMFFMLIMLPVLHMLFLFRSSLQGMNNSLIPMLSGFAEMIVRLITITTLPMAIGKWGIYISEVLPWPAATIMLCIAYFSVYKNRCAMFEGEKRQALDERYEDEYKTESVSTEK